MTWQGILIIGIASVAGAFVASWLDEHVFKNTSGKCEKCGHINGEETK